MANVILTDGRNQKELLQTPKNREAHNIPNICHAMHASLANSYACEREPFAATPPQHLAAMAVPCWLLLLPRKAPSSGEHGGFNHAVALLTPGHRGRATKSQRLEIKCSRREAGYLLSFRSPPFRPFGVVFLDFFPIGKCQNHILVCFGFFFLQKVYVQAWVCLNKRAFPHNLNLQSISWKQDIKQGSARPPLPLPHSCSSKNNAISKGGKWPEGKSWWQRPPGQDLFPKTPFPNLTWELQLLNSHFSCSSLKF